MGVSTSAPDEGVAVVTVGFSPFNALPVQGWYDFAAAVRATGAGPRAASRLLPRSCTGTARSGASSRVNGCSTRRWNRPGRSPPRTGS